MTDSKPRDRDALRALIKSMPERVLRDYTLAALKKAPQDMIPSLLTFFDKLALPPLLHCARCHQEYYEVENDSSACHMDHDENPIEDENCRGPRRCGETPMGYFGCCGKFVYEEEKLYGPPDGWCFEGRHTTSARAADYRTYKYIDISEFDRLLMACDEPACLTRRSAEESE